MIVVCLQDSAHQGINIKQHNSLTFPLFTFTAKLYYIVVLHNWTVLPTPVSYRPESQDKSEVNY